MSKTGPYRRDFVYDPKETNVKAILQFKTRKSYGVYKKWDYRLKKNVVEQYINNTGHWYNNFDANEKGTKIIFELLDNAVYMKGAEDNPSVWIGEHRKKNGVWECGSNGCYKIKDYKKIKTTPPPLPKPPCRDELEDVKAERDELYEEVKELRGRLARVRDELGR